MTSLYADIGSKHSADGSGTPNSDWSYCSGHMSAIRRDVHHQWQSRQDHTSQSAAPSMEKQRMFTYSPAFLDLGFTNGTSCRFTKVRISCHCPAVRYTKDCGSHRGKRHRRESENTGLESSRLTGLSKLTGIQSHCWHPLQADHQRTC